MTTLCDYTDPYRQPVQQHEQPAPPPPAPRRLTMTRGMATVYLQADAGWSPEVVDFLLRTEVWGSKRYVFPGPIKIGESLVIDLSET